MGDRWGQRDRDAVEILIACRIVWNAVIILHAGKRLCLTGRFARLGPATARNFLDLVGGHIHPGLVTARNAGVHVLGEGHHGDLYVGLGVSRESINQIGRCGFEGFQTGAGHRTGRVENQRQLKRIVLPPLDLRVCADVQVLEFQQAEAQRIDLGGYNPKYGIV